MLQISNYCQSSYKDMEKSGAPCLSSLPDLSRVSQFKQSSPGLTILIWFLTISTEPLFFICLRLNG